MSGPGPWCGRSVRAAALQVPELPFDGVELLVGQPVGFLLSFVGFLLRLIEFPLGLDEAVEPARQVQKLQASAVGVRPVFCEEASLLISRGWQTRRMKAGGLGASLFSFAIAVKQLS